MPSYRVRTALAGLMLAIFVSGCGGDDLEGAIEKSPHAPSQAQFDEMKASMLKGKTAKKPASAAKQ
ncbi:MAG: hypothetical protein P4L85_01810 [Paludisphaera borealis]|uniref:hypothetical protein n=1 Tax=Paludisphaera borealis TaxID=1387353 RepID=UPI00284E7B84|nr:hypothetical protein [Paludisphaera borealis]MDR3618056.1 hypothetical protein [Paludisphaera borealis]